jgi:hypothetical protein
MSFYDFNLIKKPNLHFSKQINFNENFPTFAALIFISSDSEVNLEEAMKFHPPNGFSDSRELSEAECDRDVALDLEVQQALDSKMNGKIHQEEMTSLLVAR